MNDNIRCLFNLVFQGWIPPEEAAVFFTDAYLFFLHKDPDDLTKLRPIAIPSGMRRLTASHIMVSYRQPFATDMLPLNYAIGVDGGMDSIIKIVQLGIETHISGPQQRGKLPTRAAVFFDLKNMFNNMHRRMRRTPSSSSNNRATDCWGRRRAQRHLLSNSLINRWRWSSIKVCRSTHYGYIKYGYFIISWDRP